MVDIIRDFLDKFDYNNSNLSNKINQLDSVLKLEAEKGITCRKLKYRKGTQKNRNLSKLPSEFKFWPDWDSSIGILESIYLDKFDSGSFSKYVNHSVFGIYHLLVSLKRDPKLVANSTDGKTYKDYLFRVKFKDINFNAHTKICELDFELSKNSLNDYTIENILTMNDKLFKIIDFCKDQNNKIFSTNDNFLPGDKFKAKRNLIRFREDFRSHPDIDKGILDQIESFQINLINPNKPNVKIPLTFGSSLSRTSTSNSLRNMLKIKVNNFIIVSEEDMDLLVKDYQLGFEETIEEVANTIEEAFEDIKNKFLKI